MGWLIRIVIDKHLYMIEFFRLLRIGFAWNDNETGKALCFICGLSKLDANITLGIKKKLAWHEAGQA